ncbi:MAG TPA: toll/interleukin-1 receptor domain-containing protein [Solirubrobacterales bacterium]|nr:toll/interleukin-1 receptor domain-containing protein [Solirubrobacterales bacterium]
MIAAMAGPGAPKKPTVFLSHAVTDEPIAKVIHDEIRGIFSDGVNVFASSVPGVVKPGRDWLKEIRVNLDAATAVIVIVSPVSLNRPWVWFEVGASWSRMEEGEGVILPICVPEIDKGSLPEPLGRLQAMSLGKAAETKAVFQALIDQFDFGRIKGFRHGTIKAKLPKYEDLTVADADLKSGVLYTGPYDVFENWLLHFRQVDADYALPPGTAKALLEEAASLYPVRAWKTENTIRFEELEGEPRERWEEERA